MCGSNCSIPENYIGATGYDDKPDMIDIYAHEALCLVCCEGGCPMSAQKKARYKEMLKRVKADSMLPMRLRANLDVTCIRGKNKTQQEMAFDHVSYWRDLEVLRRLGLSANSVRSAYHVFNEIFKEFKNLDGLCSQPEFASQAWPKCEHHEGGYFQSVAKGPDVYTSGVYKILSLPRREDLVSAKQESAAAIAKADRLYIRPAHLMCLMCVYGRPTADEPLWQDNLVELRKRIQQKPDIDITLCLGSNCDVCPPCPVYDKDRNLCLGHEKAQNRDCMVLRRLGLAPYSTVKAKELFTLLLDRIKTTKEICGWGDMRETSPDWRNCADVTSGNYERGREKGLFK